MFRSLLLLTGMLLALPPFVFAQETIEGPAYVRPDYKVYKSLSAALANPDSVYILDLKGKNLKEIPPGVFSLPNLQVLDLSRNKIREVPAEIAKMTSLEELNLSNNKFKEFPEAVTKLRGLRKLALNRNLIEVIPPSIGNMESLEYLELWDNEIGTLPDEMGQLKRLRFLELRGILFSVEQHQQFRDMLPDTQIMLSPSCNCKTQ